MRVLSGGINFITRTCEYIIVEWKVLPEESGMKLQAFIKLKLDDSISARQIKQAIENNCCTVNTRIERFASYNVGTGDTVKLKMDIPQDKPVAIKFEQNRVLFEDSNYLIYDKPANISSDSNEFLKTIQRKLPYLALAHRLDKDTTGVLIFAKNELALSAILALFKGRLINKEYIALVDGIPTKEKGRIDNLLGELKRYQGQTIWGSVATKGLPAITDWEIKRKGKGVALINCYPKTGRTHQIRVHLSEMGNPILGDFQYGKRFLCVYKPARCLLHAAKVSFIHPTTGKAIEVSSPIPADFAEAIEKLF